MKSCNLCKDGVVTSPRYNQATNCGGEPTQLNTVVIPLEKGGDGANEPNAPKLGMWKNTLVRYEKTGSVYLYDINGVYTNLTGTDYASQIVDLTADMKSLKERLSSLQEALAQEISSREGTDTELQSGIDALNEELTATEQALKEAIAEATSTANEAMAKANDAAATANGEATARAEADNALQAAITAETEARQAEDGKLQAGIDKNAQDIADLQAGGGGGSIDASFLNKTVQYDTTVDADMSTVTITKTTGILGNISTEETNMPLPVASADQAGIMNASTYNAVQQNAENVDAILNGAVAIDNVPASPSDEELTNLWKNATSRSELINRASIFDVTNQKLWYYYENDGKWHTPAGGSGGVTVSIATNDTPGIVQGSVTTGQVAVEPNGKMSVNGWDATQSTIANIDSRVETLEKGGSLKAKVVQSITSITGSITPNNTWQAWMSESGIENGSYVFMGSISVNLTSCTGDGDMLEVGVAITDTGTVAPSGGPGKVVSVWVPKGKDGAATVVFPTALMNASTTSTAHYMVRFATSGSSGTINWNNDVIINNNAPVNKS